jgi:hypothetical protein
MKLGAEPKKLAWLGGLLLLLLVYWLFFSGSEDEAARNTPRPTPAVAPTPAPRQAAPAETNIRRSAPLRAGRSSSSSGAGEFKPTLKPKRPEDRPDPATVDPALRLDLLHRLQQVKSEGGERNLFEFSAAPPPKEIGPPEKKIHAKLSKMSPIAAAVATAGAARPASTTPLKPAAPPIPLKFYGYLSPLKAGVKRAFFLAGEEIFVAAEGDLVQRRYKVIRISTTSVVMEDVQFKSQQTLMLEVQPG